MLVDGNLHICFMLVDIFVCFYGVFKRLLLATSNVCCCCVTRKCYTQYGRLDFMLELDFQVFLFKKVFSASAELLFQVLSKSVLKTECLR